MTWRFELKVIIHLKFGNTKITPEPSRGIERANGLLLGMGLGVGNFRILFQPGGSGQKPSAWDKGPQNACRWDIYCHPTKFQFITPSGSQAMNF